MSAKRSGSESDRSSGREFDASICEIAIDELREFLEAELFDVKANPKFKEKLRQTIWELVESKQRRASFSANRR